MRDSYERFFSKGHITKEQFFEFGLEETIYAPLDKAQAEWSALKNRIANNQKVSIRKFGKDGNGTSLFQEFYKHVLGNENVEADPTNNAEPTRVIRNLTGYAKIKKSGKFEPIQNYQISHIFGRTKNVFAFTASWNIVYIPKIVDPFTGHEAKGEMSDEYEALFQRQSFKHFEPLIEDYNKLMACQDLRNKIEDYLQKIKSQPGINNKDVEKLIKSVEFEFSPIESP